ncbi:N-acetylmuramoyl-L-alanine amidase [Patulibacter defluvii]|uniref:N-acetylmuramoyl-L-alanine amidase n=1 Tax=Patulibacter defluvii TaxID=3095358 RepID=UPI002A756DF8|nr:N-acetylmuramoyl-L-alanine amidase [Patulibacter sp. DM4]
MVRAGATLGAAIWLGGAAGADPVAAATRGRGLVVPRSQLRPGRVVGLRAPRRFDLLGGSLDALRGSGVEVRTRPRGGRWSRWTALSDHGGHAPDGERSAISDPVWFGGADELQLRTRRQPRHDLALELVSVPAAEQRAGARATARAVAEGGVHVAAPRNAGEATATLRAAQPTIVPRAAWAGNLKPKSGPDMGQVQVAFVHHTVNGNTYQPEQSAGIVRAIAEYHMRSNGWNDIGYNFLVDRFGQIFEGRAGGIDQPVVGAQAVGWNSLSTGIAIIGTFDGEPAPDAALNAVAALIRWKLPLHGAPTAGTVPLVSVGGAGNRWAKGATVAMNRVSGHQDGCSTDCPGRALYGQLPTLRSRVGGSAGPPPTTLSLDVQKEIVEYGGTLGVSGRLAIGGAGVGGSQVVVEKKSPSGQWVPMATATTDGSGNWDARVRWKRSSPIRARSGGVVSKQATPPIAPKFSLTQPSRHVRKGNSFKVTGRAQGTDAIEVILQRKVSDTRFPVVYRRRLKLKGSRFTLRVPVRRTGLQRVVAQTRSGGKLFQSPRRYLRGV